MLLYLSLFTFLLSLLLSYNNWKTNRNRLFLSLFFVCLSVFGITHYFITEGKSPFWLAIFYNHFTPLMLMVGPFLFFYVRGAINNTNKINKLDLVHFIPALIHFIGIIPYCFQPFSEKLKIASAITQNIDTILTIETNYFFSTEFNFFFRPSILLFYIVYCMYLIGKKHSISSIGSKAKKTELLINLRWIILLLTILLVVIVNYLVIIASLIHSKPSETLTSFYPLYITSGIAFYFLSLSLLLFPNILYGIPEFIAISSKKKKKKKKPLIEIATPIESDFYQDLSERMKKYLTTEKPFTNPNFKISDIAIALNVTQNEVFYCINEVLKTKFSDLKSELRIKYAVELLTSDFQKTLTIEGIAKQSGFNSRGIFYSAFKKIMGITPTEYISNLKNE